MTTEIPFYTQTKADELLAAKADKSTLGDASTHPASDFATAAQGATADTALQPADVGSAAGHPATDFATSAQGGKADTAVQPARQVTAGTGLSGGGDLSADRTLAVQFGTTAGTVAQGNDSRIVGAAPLASPAFTGNPTAPTPAAGDNDTSIATTAFVQGAKVAAFLNTAAVDLNTYLTPGTFFMSTLASGAGSANFPSQFAGMLRVTGAAGFYVQEYITVRDLYPRAPLTYTRYYDGAWTPWVVGRNSLPLTGNTITGTGSPQGLVAAPVGTTYVDIAATAGAIEWTKLSGTGNSRWIVTKGFQQVDITASLINGWTATRVVLYRYPNLCMLTYESLSSAAATNDLFYAFAGVGYTANPNAYSQPLWDKSAVRVFTDGLHLNGYTANQSYKGSHSWPGSLDWPTS